METETKPSRGRGRPVVYPGSKDGSPKVTVRLDEDCHRWLLMHKGGMRVYLQRLIRADMEAVVAETERQAEEKRRGNGSKIENLP